MLCLVYAYHVHFIYFSVIKGTNLPVMDIGG